MIVHSRQKNQSLVIGQDIIVTVIEIIGDEVRLGIELPRDARAQRGEVRRSERQLSAAEEF
jgi:carbon storage regulator